MTVQLTFTCIKQVSLEESWEQCLPPWEGGKVLRAPVAEQVRETPEWQLKTVGTGVQLAGPAATPAASDRVLNKRWFG